MNLYNIKEFKKTGYTWDIQGRKTARRYIAAYWSINALAIIFICVAACLNIKFGFLKINGYFYLVIADIIFAFGLRITASVYTKNRLKKKSLETRYDYNLYLYHHHRYWKNKLTANMVLFSNAVIDIKRKKYVRAKQELDLMYSEKHKINDLKKIYFLKVIIACYEQNEEELKDAFVRYTGIKDTTVDYPDADTLMNWILDNDIEKMTEMIDKIVIPVKKRNPVWICGLTLFLTYSFIFLALCNELNHEAGYDLRRIFSFGSAVVVDAGLTIFLICVAAWIYRHQYIDDTMAAKGRKAIRFGMCVIMTVMGMNLLGIHFFSLCLKLDTKEVVTEKKNGYTYLDVYWDNLRYNSYTVAYRTNNPFIMKKVNVLSNDQVKTLKNLKKQNESDSKSRTKEKQNSKTSDGITQSDSGQNSMTENNPNQIQESDSDYLKEKAEMQAIYNYLNSTNSLQQMELSYASNAKGEIYAIVGSGTETKDGNSIVIKYNLYYNKEKMDANNTNCDEFVMEKQYVNGEYETEIIDFYLVNPDTLEVTDEHKTTW